MKSAFPGYYPPTDADYRVLWQSAVFIFDTNTLLHLYRVPEATRKQMLSALRALKGRVWIPRHVGVEFQARRLGVIKKAHQDASTVLAEIDKALESYLRSVGRAELAERGVSTAVSSIKTISEEGSKLRDIAATTLGGQMAPTDFDSIRDEIDKIFEGKVGIAPANQGEVDAWNELGKERFLAKRGPGFEDAGKAEEGSPQIYSQGITYERQYGDLYIWLQILDQVRAEGWKNVIFVTRDTKEDWWRLVPGSEKNRPIISPLESLTEEVQAAGVKRFWMYQLTAFLQEAEKYLSVTVSESTIKDAGKIDGGPRPPLLVPPYSSFSESHLKAALEYIADVVVESNPRYAVGYGEEKRGGHSAEIVFPLRVAARSTPSQLAGHIEKALEHLDLYIVPKRVNIYVLVRSTRRTSPKTVAHDIVERALAMALPKGAIGTVRFVFFANAEETELEIYNYER